MDQNRPAEWAMKAAAEVAETVLRNLPDNYGDSSYEIEEIARAIEAADKAATEQERGKQKRVGAWMFECFGPVIPFDKIERADRFIEEALELAQATGWTADRGHALVDYVFNRPVGEIGQEVGGVMVTLAALCNAFGFDMEAEATREITRITQPEIIVKIRAKQAAKPTGSALPVVVIRKGDGNDV